MAKAKQEELPGMPARDELGKKAAELIENREQQSELKNKEKAIKAELVLLFTKSGKKSISIEGKKISYSHSEKDKISIRSAGG
jgi:argonaute-like protein implicated in RNA metabolism and viral defense